MNKKDIDWEELTAFENKSSDNKELIRFVSRILRNWYWFVGCGIIGLILAYTFLLYTVPVYDIHAKLLVSDDKKGGLLGESALADLSGLMGTTSSVDNEVEVLKTADLMREMVLAEKAYITYFKAGSVNNNPTLRSPYLVKLLSSPDSIFQPYNFKIKSQKAGELEFFNADTSFRVVTGKPFRLNGVGQLQVDLREENQSDEAFGFSIIPVRNAVDAVSQSLSVEVTNKNVSTINLTLSNAIPRRGEQLLTTLIEKYVEMNLHDKNVIADSTLSFINARLTEITDELAGVEDKISGYKRSTQLADISEQSKLLLQNSADYTKSLAETETQLAVLDAISANLKDKNNPRVVPTSVASQDPSFVGLLTKYNDLVLQRERLLLGNTEDNPLVQNVSSQIANLRSDMISSVESSRRNLELAKNKQTQMSGQLTSQIQRVPTIERGYIDLARLQQIKQAQYIFLQEKWEETAIGRTANVSNSKVIDSPRADEFPFSPKKKIVYAVGLILGLIIPLGSIYIKDLLNVKIRSLDDVKTKTPLPILGAIAHSDETEQVVVNKTSRSPIAEQFRALRTNLEFALNGGKSILFTSSMSGEGKSYVALNLAVSLALLDKKVLIMELDLRKPSITSKLGISPGNGFSHYIVRQDMKIEDVIMDSGVHENVHLIQAGAIPPNPAELLVQTRTEALMDELRETYDYIIMDAPPVGIVTDAQLLNRYSDVCLYIVRQDYTYKEQILIPNDLQMTGKIKPIQLIINDVKAKGGYYSSYGYGYGYGYGDYGQEPKKKWWQFRK